MKAFCEFEYIYKNLCEPEIFKVGLDFYQKGNIIKSLPLALGTERVFVISTSDGKTVRLNFDRLGKFINSYCTCNMGNDKVCQHIVAAAMYCELSYNRLKTSGKEGDKALIGAIKYRGSFKTGDSDEDNSFIDGQTKVYLYPQIDFIDDKLLLHLEIGRGRLFAIKNIAEFLKLFENGKIYKYGNDLVFRHIADNFLDSGMKLVEYLKTIIGNSTVAPDTLLLDENQFKKIYDIFLNLNIYAKTSSNRSSFKVELTEQPPEIDLNIVRRFDNYYLSSSLGAYRVFLIDGDYYMLSPTALHRLDKAAAKCLGGFFSTLKKEVCFSEDELHRFYKDVLKNCKKYINVFTEDVTLTFLKPDKFRACIYLDVDESNRIAGKINYFYNELEVDFDKKINCIRDLQKENELKVMMKNYLQTTGSTFILADEESIFTLLNEGVEDLKHCADIYLSDNFKNISVKKSGKLNVSVRLEGNLLNVSLASDEYSKQEVAEILQAVSLKKKYIKLKNGIYLDLGNHTYTVAEELSQALNVDLKDMAAGGAITEIYNIPFLETFLSGNDKIKFVKDKFFDNIAKGVQNFHESDFLIPAGLEANLRNYQRTGYKWLCTLCHYGFGGILADDMGLGKTLQMISVISAVQKKDESSIIVCPTSLILNWRNEFNKWSSRMRVLCVYGSVHEREKLIKDYKKYDVIITSYELMRNDIEAYRDIEFCFAVIDEGQFIKNSNTLNSKSVKQLRSKYRFAMTGTPIENNLSELWSIFDFIMPGYLHTQKQFKYDFELPIIKENDEKIAVRLHNMVKPFIFRRMKQNVLTELPPKIETVVEASLTDEQKDLYNANLAIAKNAVDLSIANNEFGKNRFVMLAMLTKLRQICCSPSLVYENYTGNNAKLEMCMDLLKTSVSGGHKVLLFSQFTTMLDIIQAELKKAQIRFYDLRGSTSKPERMRLTEKFNNDDTPVFLVSLKSGGTGLNLTGADVVIHYDPWWNLSVQNQATDRAYRIGQTKSVQVYKLILAHTLEQKMLELQERKKNLGDLVIKEGELFLNDLTREELLSLFD